MLGDALWPSSLPNLEEWIDEVLRNKPCRPKEDEFDFDTIIAVDASAWGWGAVKLSRSSGKVLQISKPWGKDVPFAKISTHAEPMALAKAACVFVNPSEDGKVLFLTDSKACLGAFRRGYSGIYTVNGAVEMLQRAHPRNTFEYGFVEGKSNVADAPSRGRREIKMPSAKSLEDLAQLAVERWDQHPHPLPT
jgi:hypothetical protein